MPPQGADHIERTAEIPGARTMIFALGLFIGANLTFLLFLLANVARGN
jgi:hypothetical protein